MKFVRTPAELKFAVNQAAELLDLQDWKGNITFAKGDGLRVEKDGSTVTIGYGSITDAMRGMSFVKRVSETGEGVNQKAKFDTLSIMVDCSRNAVLNLDSAKELMVQLAVMGFNSIMFYTEDTYEIPEYPYFGHMRGRFSVEEMKELDDFGAKLGMEVIPCIQTLAHLNAITDWACFKPYIDIDDILLADDDRTYALIEAMLKTLRNCFKSHRINIGMDEAHHLGRGKHTDRFGPEEKPDIMIRHLAKVVELCKKYDFEPVMWSDMFFRMQFGGQYRISEGELSPEVMEKIPEEVALCYWEYYTNPKQVPTTDHMFKCHQKANREIWFAGGAWGWSGMCPKNHFSLWVTPAQLELAEKYGVKNVFATCWGDDGAECAIFNLLPALLQYAEYNYADIGEANMEARSMDCFGLTFEDFKKIDLVGQTGWDYKDDSQHPYVCEKYVLYNDPLLGLMDWDVKACNFGDKYAKDAATLEDILQRNGNSRFAYLFDTQYRLAKLMDKKMNLSINIKKAYLSKDKKALKDIMDRAIPEIYDLIDEFLDAFRFQWHWVNKPFGFEIQDIRLGGLKQRLVTAAERIRQYLDEEVESLPELEQPDLPSSCNPDKHNTYHNSWRRSATRSVVGHS